MTLLWTPDIDEFTKIINYLKFSYKNDYALQTDGKMTTPNGYMTKQKIHSRVTMFLEEVS